MFLDALYNGTARISIDGSQLEGEALSAAVGGVAHAVTGARRVAVTATPTVETVVAIAGVILAGAAAVPISPTASEAERLHILRDSAADLVLDPGAPKAAPLPAAPSAGETPALILYTSGSTGPPKGVVIPARAIAANLTALREIWAWSEQDVLAHALPFFHVHGLVFGALGPLHIGSKLIHTGRYFRPVRDASLYFGVPALWASMKDADLRALRGARLLVSGAGALSGALFERIRQLAGQPMLNRYAMTETLVITSPRLHDIRTAHSVGSALPGVQIRITETDHNAIGSVEVRGTSLFSGYQHHSQPFLADGWFHTGDVGRWNEQGALELLGRRDTDLIKTAGYRVGAGEVEEALLGFADIVEAAVTGLPDPVLGERIAAWVVTRRPVNRALLQEHLSQHLSAYKHPSELHVVSALPRNAMGKLQKHRLRECASGA